MKEENVLILTGSTVKIRQHAAESLPGIDRIERNPRTQIGLTDHPLDLLIIQGISARKILIPNPDPRREFVLRRSGSPRLFKVFQKIFENHFRSPLFISRHGYTDDLTVIPVPDAPGDQA